MTEYRVVDAFTDRPLAGNPAAVLVLDGPRPNAWAQGVAAEFNLSETAFVHPVEDPGADFALRWFTPAVEVDLCGHATLAASHALTELGVPGPHRFATRSGVLTVTTDGERLWLDFPANPPETGESPDGLVEALGAEPLYVGRAATGDLLVEVADEAAVRGLSPDLAALKALPARGIIATARGEAHDLVSRFFAPAVGVPEDPVTGSAHTVLAPFWAERLGRTGLTARQVSERGGDLLLRLPEGAPGRVLIGGTAVTVAHGTLRL
ncbi:PhzF family phenazine biosynthesis protein [Nocardiopsis sp. CNT312]|uniref:PhzF family phenazine biosynthesis protein n=1 Tax=Nocardiopsis sp. CNT312 TaxID=1137268 RepID=UPI00048F2189|nr:PhzF family phenazine biosynthesis protein [Nocardiopsis sp. CNT312]